MNRSLSISTLAVVIFLLSFFDIRAFNVDSVGVKYWLELMDSSNAYQQAQDYQTALKWALKAEVKAKAEFGEMDTNYVATIGMISEFWYYLGNLDSAICYGNLRLKISREIFPKDHNYFANSINNMAGFYTALGNYSEAEKLFREALEIKRRLFKTDHWDLASSINNMAYFYSKIGKNQIAESLYIEALEMYRRLYDGDNPKLAYCINNIAFFYLGVGNYQSAEPLFIEALYMNRRIFKSDNSQLANSINSLAYFYNHIGDYTKTEPLLIEAAEMKKRIYKTDHPDLAGGINNLAVFYDNIGNNNLAEIYYLEALEIYRRLYKTDRPDLALIINNIAFFYKNRGDNKKAEPLFAESLEMRRRLFKTDSPDLAGGINNVAGLYYAIGDNKKAQTLYTEALEMYRRFYKTDNPNLSTSINNMAFFYHGIGEFSKAEKLYIEALEMDRRLFKADNPRLATGINNSGLFYKHIGDYSKAEPLLVEALEMTRRIYNRNHPDLAQSIDNLASLYFAIGDKSKSEPLFIEAFDLYLSFILNYFTSLSENEKAQLWNKYFNDFERFKSFAIERISDNPIIAGYLFDNQIITKGILLSSTKKVKYNILASGNNTLINKYNEWQFLRNNIASNYNLTIMQLKKKGFNIDSMLNEANKKEKELNILSGNIQDTVLVKHITWHDIQSELKSNEACIEILRIKYHNGRRWTDSIYYAVLILRSSNINNRIELIVLKNGTDLETAYIKNYKKSMKSKFRDIESYNQFWSKIAEKLKGVKKVFVSPDGTYNQLNLTTLFNPKTNKFILDEMDIQIVTSTRDIVINKEQKKPEYNNKAVLIGNPKFNLDYYEYKKVASSLDNKFKTDYFIDEGTEVTMRSGISPLPGTGVEIDKISQLLGGRGWNIEKYTDKQAIEEVIKKVDNPRILHIATHGKFLSDIEAQYSNFDNEIDKQRFVENPLLRSYLIFAGADSPDSLKNTDLDDGFLTAYEAQNLFLDKTELVVLSACETGLGEIKNGEGVYGLQRAFIQAGAKSVIMSLWSVSDEATQELMSIFYKEWLGGKTKREAFRSAQLKLKEKYSFPYFWGAFVMVGE